MRQSLILLLLGAAAAGPAQAFEPSPYQAMASEIGGLFDDALRRYKSGDAAGAKSKVEAAYFQVFENLEGPIRVNVSAKTNYELEEEFSAIRKMIVRGEPAPAVESRACAFMTRLRSVVAELDGGVELVAEPGAGEPASLETAPGQIQPAWLEAVANIEAGLRAALETYREGDAAKAAARVEQAQFEDYKDSLLETAIRGGLSQRRNFEHGSSFSDIAGLIRAGAPVAKVDSEAASLVAQLRKDLPGLPLVPGATTRKKSAPAAAGRRDWTRAANELGRALDEAQTRYARGDVAPAVSALQDAYFDVFEASGLEAEIGARDAGAKAALEAGFSLLVAKMRKGVPADRLEADWAALKSGLERAAAPLGKGQDSPWAVFLYSLMIILREGIEALLIVAMIVSYLVKTGHRDKLRVIYQGCAAAVGASVATAIAVKWALKASSLSQEALEGATMLLASAVLFSVSYWLISKLEARKWTAFIQDKIGGSLSSNSLRALWFAAFLAVYREGAETVLFYQALASGSTAAGAAAEAAGFAAGCAALAAVFVVTRRGAVKLPLKPFFIVTGSLLYVMAVVFAGKGVMELISAKAFEPTWLARVPTIPFLGFYPYAQTLVPQLVLAFAAAAALAKAAGASSSSQSAKEVSR